MIFFGNYFNDNQSIIWKKKIHIFATFKYLSYRMYQIADYGGIYE
jgi:hypothetical protein